MTAPDLDIPEPDRRESAERRLLMDRRSGVDRRQRTAPGAAPKERRATGDRRAGGERRAFLERRLSLQSASDQIRGALKLLTATIEAGSISDKQRRTLDAAMLRLRFALERIETE
jgi:hypothetical protein